MNTLYFDDPDNVDSQVYIFKSQSLLPETVNVLGNWA